MIRNIFRTLGLLLIVALADGQNTGHGASIGAPMLMGSAQDINIGQSLGLDPNHDINIGQSLGPDPNRDINIGQSLGPDPNHVPHDAMFGEPLGMATGIGSQVHGDLKGLQNTNIGHGVDHLITGQTDILQGAGPPNIQTVPHDAMFGEPIGMATGIGSQVHGDLKGLQNTNIGHGVDHLITGQTDILQGAGPPNIQTVPHAHDAMFGEPLGMATGIGSQVQGDSTGLQHINIGHGVDQLTTGQTDILQGVGHPNIQTDLKSAFPGKKPITGESFMSGLFGGIGSSLPPINGPGIGSLSSDIQGLLNEPMVDLGMPVPHDAMFGEPLGMATDIGSQVQGDSTGLQNTNIGHGVDHLITGQSDILQGVGPPNIQTDLKSAIPGKKPITGESFMSGLFGGIGSSLPPINDPGIGSLSSDIQGLLNEPMVDLGMPAMDVRAMQPFDSNGIHMDTNVGQGTVMPSGLDFGEPLGMMIGHGSATQSDKHGTSESLATDNHGGSALGEPLGIAPIHGVLLKSDQHVTHGNADKHTIDPKVGGHKDVLSGHGPDIHDVPHFGEPLGIAPITGGSMVNDPHGDLGLTAKLATDNLVMGHNDIMHGLGSEAHGTPYFGEPLGFIPGHVVSIHKDPPGVHQNTKNYTVEHLVVGQTHVLPGHIQDVHGDPALGEPLGMAPTHGESLSIGQGGISGHTDSLHGLDPAVHGVASFGEHLGIVSTHGISIPKDPNADHGNSENLVHGHKDILSGLRQDTHGPPSFGETLGMVPIHDVNSQDLSGKHMEHIVPDQMHVIETGLHEAGPALLPDKDISASKQMSGETYMSRLVSAQWKSKASDAVTDPGAGSLTHEITGLLNDPIVDMTGEINIPKSIALEKTVGTIPRHGSHKNTHVMDILPNNIKTMHGNPNLGEPLGIVAKHGSSVHGDPVGIQGHLEKHAVGEHFTGLSQGDPSFGASIGPMSSGEIPSIVKGVPDLDMVSAIRPGKTFVDTAVGKPHTIMGMTMEEKVTNAEAAVSSLMYPESRIVDKPIDKPRKVKAMTMEEKVANAESAVSSLMYPESRIIDKPIDKPRKVKAMTMEEMVANAESAVSSLMYPESRIIDKHTDKARKVKAMTMEEKAANAESAVSSLMYPGSREPGSLRGKNPLTDIRSSHVANIRRSHSSNLPGMLEDAMTDVRRMSSGLGSQLRTRSRGPFRGQTMLRDLGEGRRERTRERHMGGFPSSVMNAPGYGRTVDINHGRHIDNNNHYVNNRQRNVRRNRRPFRRGGRRSGRRRSRFQDGGLRRNLSRVARRLMG